MPDRDLDVVVFGCTGVTGRRVAPRRAGCLTPATALGTACVERFERAQVRFSVDS